MPHYVLKLDKEHDAYAIYSTIVDGFVTNVLTRAEMLQELKREFPLTVEELIEARLVRADISGASLHEPGYGWDDGPVLFLDGGNCEDWVPREELYEYTMRKEVAD